MKSFIYNNQEYTIEEIVRQMQAKAKQYNDPNFKSDEMSLKYTIKYDIQNKELYIDSGVVIFGFEVIFDSKNSALNTIMDIGRDLIKAAFESYLSE